MDGKVCCLPRELQYQYERGKISCRRLEWEGGAVSSRVALLLRSAEAQPYLPRFVWFYQTFFSLFFLMVGDVRATHGTGLGLGHFTKLQWRARQADSTFRKSPKRQRGRHATGLDFLDFRLFEKGKGVSLAGARLGLFGLSTFRLFDRGSLEVSKG